MKRRHSRKKLAKTLTIMTPNPQNMTIMKPIIA